MGSVPGWGTKIPHALRCGQNFFKNERGESISKPKIWLYNKYDNTIKKQEAPNENPVMS